MGDSNKEKVVDLCVICEQKKQDGFYLYQSFICIDCEKEIVQTSTDHPLYKFYVHQLKKALSTSTSILS